MSKKEHYLEQCRAIIESKLNFGSSEHWTNRDFIELEKKLLHETGVHLSPTTLKRLWGKVRYTSIPHPDTLDALAVFAGFGNWRTMEMQLDQGAQAVWVQAKGSTRHVPEKPAARISRHHWMGATLALLLLFGAFVCIPKISFFKSPLLSPALFSFSSRIISTGIPNSVVFTYDASAAPQGDSVFIQQSWDRRRRMPVSKSGREHSAVYYFPGYFMAKLVVGNQVVQQHEVFIPTNGWMAFIEQSPIPIYLSASEFNQDSCFSVAPEVAVAHHIPLEPDPPTICMTEVKDYHGLKTDNFEMKAALRNDYRQGAGICQFTEVVVLSRAGILLIPLSSPGCVGALQLHVGHRNIDASRADLSGFGCDLSRWTKVHCSSRNNHLEVYINDALAYAMDLPGEPADIIGVQFNFKGGGSLRDVQLGAHAQ